MHFGQPNPNLPGKELSCGLEHENTKENFVLLNKSIRLAILLHFQTSNKNVTFGQPPIFREEMGYKGHSKFFQKAIPDIK